MSKLYFIMSGIVCPTIKVRAPYIFSQFRLMFLSTEHSMRYLHLRKFTSDKERICPNILKFNLKHDLSSV